MRIKAIFVLLAGVLMLIASGCSANTAAQMPVGSTATEAAASAVPVAPATTVPPVPPSAASKAVAAYMSLVGGNVPGNREVLLPTGRQCFIHYGGRLTELSSGSGKVLVSYDFPYTLGGGNCSKGVQFQLPIDEFNSMPAATKLADDKLVAELKAIGSMGIPQKPLVPADPPPTGYVRVMNIEPLHNGDSVFPFWSLCSLYDPVTGAITGHFGKLGQTPWGTLVELTADQPAFGGDCPTGTLIILEDQQLNVPMFLEYEKFLPLS